MTDRGMHGAEGATVCPFVALESDRDARADRPDHRHRCFAEPRPAPRALAHQEAYCLSPSFPVCPTFQDWARREAAHARGGAWTPGPEPARPEPPPERHPLPPPDRGWVSPAGSVPGELEDPPRRTRDRRDWMAPPPWSDEADEAARQRTEDLEADTPAFLAGRSRPDTSAYRSPGRPDDAGEVVDDARASEPSDSRRRWDEFVRETIGAGGESDADDDWRAGADESAEDEDDAYVPRRDRDQARGLVDRRPRVGGTRDRSEGSMRDRREGDRAPSWERPRRYEAYPTLKTRVGLPNMPRIGVALLAVIAAAAVLFFVPPLFLGLVDDGGSSGATPSTRASVAPSPSPEPTPIPSPTPQVYVVESGDTLSKIAKQFGVTIDEILAVNPDITNPNKISQGQEITIPAPSPSPVPVEPSPSP